MSHSIKKLTKTTLFSASIILCFLIPGTLYAQLPYMPQTDVNVPDQSIYLEAGGNGILFSMNYDLLFQNNFGFRLGISGLPQTSSDNNNGRTDWDDFRDTPFIFSVIMGNYFIGNHTSSLELGAGIVLGDVYDDENWDYPLPNATTFTIGYRYMSEKKWYPTFKAGLTPMIGFNGKAYMRFGISIGVMISGEE